MARWLQANKWEASLLLALPFALGLYLNTLSSRVPGEWNWPEVLLAVGIPAVAPLAVAYRWVRREHETLRVFWLYLILQQGAEVVVAAAEATLDRSLGIFVHHWPYFLWGSKNVILQFGLADVAGLVVLWWLMRHSSSAPRAWFLLALTTSTRYFDFYFVYPAPWSFWLLGELAAGSIGVLLNSVLLWALIRYRAREPRPQAVAALVAFGVLGIGVLNALWVGLFVLPFMSTGPVLGLVPQGAAVVLSDVLEFLPALAVGYWAVRGIR